MGVVDLNEGGKGAMWDAVSKVKVSSLYATTLWVGQQSACHVTAVWTVHAVRCMCTASAYMQLPDYIERDGSLQHDSSTFQQRKSTCSSGMFATSVYLHVTATGIGIT
jgi:hypothetical protein